LLLEKNKSIDARPKFILGGRNIMIHFHFGAGRLGLGLIGPAFAPVSRNFVLMNRDSSDSARRDGDLISPFRRNILLNNSHAYLIEYLDSSSVTRERNEFISYTEFVLYNDTEIDTLALSFSEAISDERDVLITATLVKTEAYHSVVRFINGISEKCPSSKIYLIACENDFDTSRIVTWFNKEFTRRDRLIPVNAVVDRICVQLLEEYETLCVRCERYGLITIEATKDTKKLEEYLSSCNLIRFTNYFYFEKQLKILIVNGGHLSIALAAFSEDYTELDVFLGDSNENHSWAFDVLKEIEIGAAQYLISTDVSVQSINNPNTVRAAALEDEYVRARAAEMAESALTRFSQTKDKTVRILSRFRRPQPVDGQIDNVQKFIDRLNSRIKPSIDGYREAKKIQPANLMDVIMIMLDLIGKGLFVDVDEARRLFPENNRRRQ